MRPPRAVKARVPRTSGRKATISVKGAIASPKSSYLRLLGRNDNKSTERMKWSIMFAAPIQTVLDSQWPKHEVKVNSSLTVV